MQHKTAHLPELDMHYVEAGNSAQVVVLLHGWAQTWYEWRQLIPGLATLYRVIAPDLRGLGSTSRPAKGYDKRTLALDIKALLDHLGVNRCVIVGHDFGMAVGFAFAHEFPEVCAGFVAMEFMLPGFGGEQGFNVTRNAGRWHLVFHAKCDLAPLLIQGKEREYLSWFYESFSVNKQAITQADIDEYVRHYAQPGAMEASLRYYRTMFDDEDQNRLYGKRRLRMPVLALGGEGNMGARVLAMMQSLADDVSGGSVPGAGHWLPEERPDYLADVLPRFVRKCLTPH